VRGYLAELNTEALVAEDKKLESFKIGDTQQAGVRKAGVAPGPTREEQSEAASLGFRRIETILEENDAAAVTESLGNLLQNLEAFEKRAKNNREKAAVKKATIAVERTADLLDYLFQTKSAMQQSQ
jgi:hypothetical protein